MKEINEMNDKLINIKQKALEEHIPIIMDDTLEVIAKILEENNPKRILEIGTAVGYSAICFSKYLAENGRIDTIERDEERIMEAKKNIKEMNLEDVIQIYEGDAVDILPGAEFELQFRTNKMHQGAVNGSSKHSLYKERLDDSIKKVFKIDDFSKVNIVGFTSYNSIDDDIDGIHHAKSLFNRRISSTLVSNIN